MNQNILQRRLIYFWSIFGNLLLLIFFLFIFLSFILFKFGLVLHLLVFLFDIDDTECHYSNSHHEDNSTLNMLMKFSLKFHIDQETFVFQVDETSWLKEFNNNSFFINHIKIRVINVELDDNGQWWFIINPALVNDFSLKHVLEEIAFWDIWLDIFDKSCAWILVKKTHCDW